MFQGKGASCPGPYPFAVLADKRDSKRIICYSRRILSPGSLSPRSWHDEARDPVAGDGISSRDIGWGHVDMGWVV
jgi:hypothetical protein